MKLLAVATSYYSDAYLPGLVEALDAATNSSLRIVIVDNASSGATRDLVGALAERSTSEILYVPLRMNPGYAAAVNEGIRRRADEDFILVTNPDVAPAPGSIDVLLAYLRRQEHVGLVGPSLADGNGQRSDHDCILPTWTGFWRDAFGLRRRSRLTDVSVVAREIPWVSGAFMLARTKAVLAVGVMDERFFMYMEDVDWCARFWRSGWSVALVPQARVCHWAGHAANKSAARRVVQVRLAKVIFVSKWHGRRSELLWISTILLECALKVALLTLRNPADPRVAGYRWLFRRRRDLWAGRTTSLQLRAAELL